MEYGSIRSVSVLAADVAYVYGRRRPCAQARRASVRALRAETRKRLGRRAGF